MTFFNDVKVSKLRKKKETSLELKLGIREKYILSSISQSSFETNLNHERIFNGSIFSYSDNFGK